MKSKVQIKIELEGEMRQIIKLCGAIQKVIKKDNNGEYAGLLADWKGKIYDNENH